MATQTATTGNLERAQNIVVAACRYTAEMNAPNVALVERFTLGDGNKSMTIPKVGQATAAALVDGVDMVDTQDIGLTYTELTTSEVGLKFILTDKLLRQFNEDVFKIVGRQMGDGMARKRDNDVIALFSALNAGTTLGADNLNLSIPHLTRCVSFSRAHMFPEPVVISHHPNALTFASMHLSGVGGYNQIQNTYWTGLLQGMSENVLRRFWRFAVDGVNVFSSGNIAKVAGVDSGYGAIFSKSAMCFIESKAPYTERERDASLRAWEVVMVSDYGAFEIDDTYGAPMRFEIKDLATTTT